MIRGFDDAKERRLGGVMLTAPNKQEIVKEWASEIFGRYQPKAMICSETNTGMAPIP